MLTELENKIIDKAVELLERGHCKKNFLRHKNGDYESLTFAVSDTEYNEFCITGALCIANKVLTGLVCYPAIERIFAKSGKRDVDVFFYNDLESTTQEDAINYVKGLKV